jgi:K+-transporting ATPase ATPase B chain
MKYEVPSLLSCKILIPALKNTLLKFNPFSLFHNPIMLITEIGAILCTWEAFVHKSPGHFVMNVALWLWFTVFFSNLAESIAASRNKAQAEALKKGRKLLTGNKIINENEVVSVPSNELYKGDIVVVKAGETIPADGEIIEGMASIDESSITGESSPVIKSFGTDRDSVFAGTIVLSDKIKVKISSNPGEGFLDKMITLIEGAKRKRTPNEIALTILLSGLSFMFLIVILALKIYGSYYEIDLPLPMLVALLICLIPTTIAGLLNAITIAGINRLMRNNVIAMNGSAIENAGDIDCILLDKTGTITYGNRKAVSYFFTKDLKEKDFVESLWVSSLSDTTFEGRSIVDLIVKNNPAIKKQKFEKFVYIPFSAETRMSGVNFDHTEIRKGSIKAIETYTQTKLPDDLAQKAKQIATEGGTPLVIAKNNKAIGVVYLKDIVKEDISEKFKVFRLLGIKTTMLTGDNPLTAATIAKEAGVDDFLAEASPEQKLKYLKQKQEEGHTVAMTGDGVNDAPALAHANVGVAMNSGTQAAKEAGDMIDLDSTPNKLFKIIEIGKQLLITRGSLTTFSVANDIAKFFTIFPAILIPYFPSFRHLNLMHLATPQSAVLSAVIFNALIIVFLIPLAFKGVPLKPQPAQKILRNNLLIYGIGGVILPFIGIKIIDLILMTFKLFT